jgi:ketosteroid isomerase-like protein
MPARSPEETHAVLAEAFNNGDLDALVQVYEENAVLVAPPDELLATGREEIREALAPTIALKPSARIEVVKKLQSDGLALTQARWSLAGTDAQGRRVEFAGEGSIVSRRQPDGSWRIVLDNPVRPY